MALSGSVSTSKYDGRYYTVSWTATQSTADNTSTIKWTLSADGKEGAWYAERTLKVVLAGQTVFSKTSRVEREDGKIDSGSVTLTHSSVGEKKFTIKIEGAVYGSSVNVTGEKEFTLDTIERYAKITSFSVSARDETSVKFNWSADEPCDYAKYSTDNGSTWKDLPTNNVISGLTANTSYNFKLQLRRADSKQWTTSSAVKQSTYDYPHCTESPNFILGNAVTLKFYNPLSRAFKFYIIGNGTEIDVEYSCSSTTYTGVNNPASSVPYLYNTISNAKSGKYKVKVVYDTSIKTRDNGNTYTIKESACYPTFTTFTYKDANATVTNITGNNQVLVKGLSKLTVDINATNKMIALNGATPKNYVATIDALNAPIDYSTSAITKEIGVISTVAPPSETKRLTVTAYDSRTLPKAVYKDITVYDYNLPKINVSAKRLNNFESQTTIKVSGEYSRLTINGADKNTINKVEYRYRETNGTWTSWTALTTTLSGGKITCSDEIK